MKKILVLKKQLFDFMMKIFKNIMKPFEREALTASKANTMSKYGVFENFKKIIASKIKEIESQIYSKLEFSNKEKLLALLVPNDQKELFDEIEKYFKEKGFKVFYADKQNIKELGDNKYMFISWDI